MVRKVEMYEVVCDGCGRKFGKQYSSAETARLVAVLNSSWEEIGNKNYCPYCVEYYKPKEKKQ